MKIPPMTPEDLAGLLPIEARVLNAWVVFRQTHDVDDAQVKCCERTQELFEALQAFENAVRKTAPPPRKPS